MADEPAATAAPPVTDPAPGGEAPPASAAPNGEAPPAAAPPDSPATPPSYPDVPALHWAADLDPETQQDPTIKRYDTKAAAAKALIEANKLLGDSIRLPAAEDVESWGKVWDKLGRPEAASAYTVPDDLELPEHIPLDDTTVQLFKDNAHAEGYTQKQFEAGLRMHAQWVRGLVNQAEAAAAEGMYADKAALAKEYGGSAPRVQERAQAVFEMLGSGVWGAERGKAAWQKLQDAGLAHDLDVVGTFANLYEKMREGEYLINDTYTAGVTSEDDLNTDIEAMRTRKMANDGTWTKADQQKMDDLYEQRHTLNQRRSA